ncbi:MAG TPA: arginase [Chloroflexota bacterium]|nr:arginase [Chloroflexota bacterium]
MDIGVIGVPVDLGADRRGVDMGPSALRYAGLAEQLTGIGHAVRDLGNIDVPDLDSVPEGPQQIKYLAPIAAMSQCLAEKVSTAMGEGLFPLVLGGDHSISVGSVAGVTEHRKVGVIWLDAHADFNTPETSPSGNMHGMVLAAIAGKGAPEWVNVGREGAKVNPRNIALVGTREVDPGERELLLANGVNVFTMHDVDRLGLPSVMDMAIERIMPGVEGIHLSLDMDVVDPMQAPGVGTPVLGGFNFREAHLAMEILSSTGRLVSMDVVEVNPVLDTHNETAQLGVQLTLSAMGKRIL